MTIVQNAAEAARMRAVVFDRYGPPDVLRLEEVPAPVPSGDQVLVRVAAAGVAAGDWHLMRGKPFPIRLMTGVRRPRLRILGSDVAGRVEAIGPEVTRLQKGDAVVGHLFAHGFGAFAELVCAPEHAFARHPEGLSVAEAAALPGSALAALQGLRDHGAVRAGQRVLVNGASGGVGTAAVQIAKSLGAEVTGVCSGRNAEFVRGLGADDVIDYTREDFAGSGRQWDVILDAAAFRSVGASLSVLVPGGRYVLVGGDFRRNLEIMLLGPILSALGGRRLLGFVTKATHEDLVHLRDLAAAGKLRPPLDRRFPLDEVPHAIAYVETGRARGKVVIEIA